MSGIRGYVRATCNPDPDSFLRVLIAWWIDEVTGFPIKERSGVLRYFVRIGDELHWADTKAELVKKFGAEMRPKSLTFIPSKVTDNPILLQRDPDYLANLLALPAIERAQLLDGNWNVRAVAGSYFKREWFGIVDKAPADAVRRVRFWDRGATERRAGTDPDATAGLLLSKDRQGVYYIEDVRKVFASPFAVEKLMCQCAESDGRNTTVSYHQDPGSAGVAEAQAAARALDGFNVRFKTATGDKETRAKPVSAQAEAGNVKIVRGLWNQDFLRELENFPQGNHDDQVDALSGAYEHLATYRKIILV
jgi:predicted phage terminase large subunit-like protein